jgi:hypothetical protein
MYEADMDIAREIGGADYIETMAGYNGSGVRGEVFDAGFNLAHVDFQSRPLILHGNVGSDSHGASTSGIVLGMGLGTHRLRDAAGRARNCGDYNYIGLEGTNRYFHTGELVQDPYYGVFETASVGSDRTTDNHDLRRYRFSPNVQTTSMGEEHRLRWRYLSLRYIDKNR